LLTVVLTGLVAWLVRRWMRQGRIGWRGVAGWATALLIVVPSLVFAAYGSTFTDEYDLFGWWYVPFIAVTGAVYAACLIGWVVGARR
jgi:protein-S-isoprenylcysteine O-methyltransferase Ste14